METNRTEDFFSSNLGQPVHADFIDFKGNLNSAVGILNTEERENKDGEMETFVIIESETDLDVIPLVNIKKIYAR